MAVEAEAVFERKVVEEAVVVEGEVHASVHMSFFDC